MSPQCEGMSDLQWGGPRERRYKAGPQDKHDGAWGCISKVGSRRAGGRYAGGGSAEEAEGFSGNRFIVKPCSSEADRDWEVSAGLRCPGAQVGFCVWRRLGGWIPRGPVDMTGRWRDEGRGELSVWSTDGWGLSLLQSGCPLGISRWQPRARVCEESGARPYTKEEEVTPAGLAGVLAMHRVGFSLGGGELGPHLELAGQGSLAWV